MIVLILSLIYIESAQANTKADKTYSYRKVPKSLFLIKKAELQASDGEPTINFANKQKQSVINDERLVYKP